MMIESIENLVELVKSAGTHALAVQARRPVEKSLKDDGSVVTALDKEVETFLVGEMSRHYPEANIVSEETSREQVAEREFTFLLDPIDGTDSFSQGMPSWCVSVGLLDRDYQPVAGIIYAPALDLLLFADVGKRAVWNGLTIQLNGEPDGIDSSTNLMIPSSAHYQVDLRHFRGKVRSIGSAALHLCYPLIYPRVFGAIESRGAHAWDIGGAHAINRSVGFDFELIDGRKIDYCSLLDGRPIGEIFLSGSPNRIAALKSLIKKI